jgi:hypothetical protein
VRVTSQAPNSFWGLRWNGGNESNGTSYSAYFGLETSIGGDRDMAVFSTDGAVSYSNKSCSRFQNDSSGIACFVDYPFNSFNPTQSYQLRLTALDASSAMILQLPFYGECLTSTFQ